MAKNCNFMENQKGYNVTLWYKDGDSNRIETMLFKSRSEMLAHTKRAEVLGCYAWQVTYLSKDV